MKEAIMPAKSRKQQMAAGAASACGLAACQEVTNAVIDWRLTSRLHPKPQKQYATFET
jgi:hypothetical protein